MTNDSKSSSSVIPPNTRKFKHRIVLVRKEDNKAITGVPLTHNETNELVAFVDIDWNATN